MGSFISNFGQMKGTMMRTFIVLAVVLGFNAFFLQTAKVAEAAKIQNPVQASKNANNNGVANVLEIKKDVNHDGIIDSEEAEQDSNVGDLILSEEIQNGEPGSVEAEPEYAADTSEENVETFEDTQEFENANQYQDVVNEPMFGMETIEEAPLDPEPVEDTFSNDFGSDLGFSNEPQEFGANSNDQIMDYGQEIADLESGFDTGFEETFQDEFSE